MTKPTLPPTLADYITHRLSNEANPLRMDGWCTPEKATALAMHVLAAKPTIAIEIGVFAGRSLFAIALAMRENDVGTVLGIDPWSPSASVSGFESDPANRDWWAKLDHNAIYQQCVRVQAELTLTNVHLFRGTSTAALPLLRFACTPATGASTPVVDLLHIDGNHSTAQALFDVVNYVPMVKPGGVVIFDDIEWESTKKAQAALGDLCTFDKLVSGCGFYTRKGSVTPALAIGDLT